MSTQTNALTADLLCEIPKRFRGTRVWRCTSGMLYDRSGRPVRIVRINGLPVIQGVLAPYGRFLGVEVKAGSDKQSPVQKQAELVIRTAGGIYIVAKSIDQCIADLLQLCGPA